MLALVGRLPLTSSRRYADRDAASGGMSRESFAKLVADLQIKAPATAAHSQPTPRTDFEAGRVFER